MSKYFFMSSIFLCAVLSVLNFQNRLIAMEFTSLVSMQAYFSNELTCAQYLEHQRWQGNPICPHCGSEHHYRTKTRFKHPELRDGYKDFFCKACRKKYSVLTGSAYESSKIPLRMWLSALYLLSAHKKGISSTQLSRDLGIPQKTAWFMLHRIRETLEEKSPEMLDGVVSSDETFVGGKAKNKQKHKRKEYRTNDDRLYYDKTPVLGIMQYGGPVRCFVLPDVKRESILPILYRTVVPGSTVYTDEWRGYRNIGLDYDHHVVEHSKHQYRNGYATTNNIEGFWGLFKRCILGIYHWVSPKHLQRYCHEISFRYNYRHMSDAERFDFALRNCNDTRLLYKVLTAKH